MRHASTVSKICLNVSVPSLVLPSTCLPMTPVTADNKDNKKLLIEYSALKEQLRDEILASALASALDSRGGLMLEVNSRCSTNMNVQEIEALEIEVHVSAYARAWWMKRWMSLEVVPVPCGGKGNYIEEAHANADVEEETKALSYTREDVATQFEYSTNNNIEPSQGQRDAQWKRENETNTITRHSAGTTTTPPSFIAVVIGVLTSFFCLLPCRHNDSDVEMTPQAAPEADTQFQALPFNSERTQTVWKRLQPGNVQEPVAAVTHMPTWSRYKGGNPASNPPFSELAAITSGHRGKGPALTSLVYDRTSIPGNPAGKNSEVSKPREQSDDGADKMWTSIESGRKGKGPAPPSPVSERTSSTEADAYPFSNTLGKAHSTGRVPAEESLQEAYVSGWGMDEKADKLSGVWPSKEEIQGGLWLDWEEEAPIAKHRAPAMSSGLESTTMQPSEAEKRGRTSPPEADTEGLWLEWDEPESEPILRNGRRAPVAASSLEPYRMSSPEAEALRPDQEGPSVPAHITPVISPDSGLELEIMPGSYADRSPCPDSNVRDTPRPQFTPIFGPSAAPAQQLQVIVPSRSPSPPRRPFYSLPNAQLHGRDVIALRRYPQEDDEYVPLQLERYLFAPIRPPFLHDHNNIVGPRVLAQTRPRGESQMRRMEPTTVWACESRGPATRIFEELDMENEEFESGEDETYADDLRETWGQGLRRSWF